MDDAPAELGGWRLVELLGRGGMGEVWRAEREGIAGVRRRAALKRILPTLRTDPMLRERFLSEARTSARLEHPNIVQVLDFGDRPEPYLAFEFVDGLTAGDVLREVSAAKQRIPAIVAAYIIGEVAQGLDYAHRKRDEQGRPLDIVHRDVSPHNVLISFEGAVKVTDFGVARARDNSVRTAAGMSVGKLVYMSPEQASGQVVDGRADIFSLGVALWELLTCRPLLPRNDPAGALTALMRCEFPAPSSVVPNLPPALDQLVLTALAREPGARFATAGAMAQALRGFIHSIAPGFGPADLVRILGSLLPGMRFRPSMHPGAPSAAMPAGVSGGHAATVVEMAAHPIPYAAPASPLGATGPLPPSALAAAGPPPSSPRAGARPDLVLPSYGAPAPATGRGFGASEATAFERSMRPARGRTVLVAIVAALVTIALGAAAAMLLRPRREAAAPPEVPDAPSTAPGVPAVPIVPTELPLPSGLLPAPSAASGAPAVPAPAMPAPVLPGAPTASDLAAPPPTVLPGASALEPAPTAPSALPAEPAPPATGEQQGPAPRPSRSSRPAGLLDAPSGELDARAVLRQQVASLRNEVRACVGAVVGSRQRVHLTVVYNGLSAQYEQVQLRSSDVTVLPEHEQCVRQGMATLSRPSAPGLVSVSHSFRY